MRLSKRVLLWFSAVALLSAALALVIAAGLPDRAAYSGQILPNGQTVAPEIGAFAPPFRAPTLDGVDRSGSSCAARRS